MSDAQALRDFALEVVLRLRHAGFEALWAGGCVRDLLLGRTPVDYDVATNATPEQVMLSLPFRAVTVGISFGVVRIRHPRTHGIEVEVATYRSDSAYVDGRRPTAVVFSSPELDAARRDFTINGMFMDPESSQVIDYVGGLDDLRNQVLRAIGDPAGAVSRGQAAVAAGRSVRGPIQPRNRAEHVAVSQGDGGRGRRRLARADRPGTAADARARESCASHEHGARGRPACRHNSSPG